MLLGDRVQEEPRLYLPFDHRSVHSTELHRVYLAALGAPLAHASSHIVQALLDEALRQLERVLLDERRDYLLLEPAPRVTLGLRLEAVAHLHPEVEHRLGLRDLLRERVVDRREPLLAHLSHAHVEVDRLPRQVSHAGVLRERYGDRSAVAGAGPEECLLQLAGYLAGAQLVAGALDAGVRYRLAVAPQPVVVDDDEVACAGGPIDLGEVGVGVSELLDRTLHVLVRDEGHPLLEGEALVLAEFDLGAYLDRRREVVVAVRGRALQVLHDRVADGAQFLLPYRVGNRCSHERLDGLDLRPHAELALDHVLRGLALAEARRLVVLRVLRQALGQALLDFLGRQADPELSLPLVKFFDTYEQPNLLFSA